MSETTAPLRLYTIEEVAEMFRVSRRTMQDHIKQYPFYRVLGRRKLFTDENIAELMGALQWGSNSSGGKAAPIGMSEGQSGASLFSRARALTARKSPKKSGRGGSPRP